MTNIKDLVAKPKAAKDTAKPKSQDKNDKKTNESSKSSVLDLLRSIKK